jgi:hypothetical protein
MKPLRLVVAVLALCFLALGVLILFPSLPDPTCTSLLARSVGEVAIHLPANCALVPDAVSDEMVNYLEHERSSRSLVFRKWITCSVLQTGGFAFMNDPHWLPSYVPGTYQYRRTVIVVPYARSIAQGSPIVGEVCLMPWRKYISQVAGQCDGKFSVWK